MDCCVLDQGCRIKRSGGAGIRKATKASYTASQWRTKVEDVDSSLDNQAMHQPLAYDSFRPRMGVKSGGGEIVQVQGGHIVRSTGRKDRHSKVYTAKGPRDRRVRLSAHTAIQFYDVQDRLGYDRPSKAVDWLIKKAKNAIDKLEELPPWHPTPPSANTSLEADHDLGSDGITIPEQADSPGFNFQVQRQLAENSTHNNSAFFPQSMVSDDTMKSLFPATSGVSTMNFQSYPIEDLGLSLHSFQGQSLLHGQSQANTNTIHSNEQNLFSTSVPSGFDPSFQRMAAWGNVMGSENRVSVGFSLNPMQLEQQQPQQQQPESLASNHPFPLRGTLQSTFLQSFRPWNDLPLTSNDHSKTQGFHQSLAFNGREGLQAFSIPAPLHRQEEQSIVSDTPTSSSPNSRQ